MMRDIRVLADAEEVAAAAAEILAEQALRGGNIALSGGSTPREAYRLAAGRLRDWTNATLWYGDERCVPPDHALSNHAMVVDSLVMRLPEEGAPKVERVMGEEGAQVAAGDYEARLRGALGNRPRLDLALMGLGPDAHTASLFPGKPAVEETGRFVAEVPEAGMAPQVPRVTLTLPVFNGARAVVFLVAGADKAPAMRRAFGDDPDWSSPAARIDPEHGSLLVLCDEAAASEL